MRRSLPLLLLFASILACLCIGFAYAGPVPLSLTASGFAVASSDSVSGESADAGPSPAADGYVGTFSWDYSISSGVGSLSYCVVYEVDYYDGGSGTWEPCSIGAVNVTDAAGSSGGHAIDFYADLTALPDSYYQLSAWVATTDSSGNIKNYEGGSSGDYGFSYELPPVVPRPEPKTPPYIPGGPSEPPTSGPVGPGTSVISY